MRLMMTTPQPEVDEDEHGILKDERCADDGPFQERFLPQELFFAHSEYFLRHALQGHLLNKADWCALIAQCEGAPLQ